MHTGKEDLDDVIAVLAHKTSKCEKADKRELLLKLGARSVLHLRLRRLRYISIQTQKVCESAKMSGRCTYIYINVKDSLSRCRGKRWVR